MKINVQKLNNGTFKTIFKQNALDWCLIASGKMKLGVILKIAIQSMKTVIPAAIHDCPYTGSLEIEKYNFPRPLLMLYPAGEFKFVMQFLKDSKEFLRIDWDFVMA